VNAAAIRPIDIRPVRVRRSRLLDGEGRVLVQVGEIVDERQAIARGSPHREPVIVDVAAALGVRPREAHQYLRHRVGDRVGLDQIIAARSGPLGLRPRVARSPVAGTIQAVIEISGEVVIRPDVGEEILQALFPGTVVSVVPRRGATIETITLRAAGLAGVGRVVSGPLLPLGDGPGHLLQAAQLLPMVRDSIILVGQIEADVVVAAAVARVAGIAAGTCRPEEWEKILRLDQRPTIVVLEGFGQTGLSPLAWDGLGAQVGHRAILDGECKHPEAVWPELLIPRGTAAGPLAEEEREICPGALVRLCSGPLAPRVAPVIRVSRFPSRLESGLEHPWVEVLLDGRRQRVSLHAVELVAPAPG